MRFCGRETRSRIFLARHVEDAAHMAEGYTRAVTEFDEG
jgi:glyoxylate carboligase